MSATSIVIQSSGTLQGHYESSSDVYQCGLLPSDGVLTFNTNPDWYTRQPYELHLIDAPAFVLRIDASAHQQLNAGEITSELASSILILLFNSSNFVNVNSAFVQEGSVYSFVQANVPPGKYVVFASFNAPNFYGDIVIDATVSITATPVVDVAHATLHSTPPSSSL